MKKLTTFLLSIGLISIGLNGFSQATKNGAVEGTVMGNKRNLEGANILLLRAKDSTTIKMVVTNAEGKFTISSLGNGKYLLGVKNIGFAKFISSPFELSSEKPSFSFGAISLKPLDKELGNVTVATKKPFIEQKLDRTIVNVDAMPTNSGLTVLEILEKAPGVVVDKDGNISLKGKDGVTILIDGRPTYLSGQDLANMLKNMPGGNLDQLEIMTNPPAKYDASGNSGVINIKTKKTKIVGFNGSATAGYGQGVYPKANGSINLNYRKGKFNFFGNGGYNYNERFQTIELKRIFRDKVSSILASVFDQDSYSKRQYNGYSYKFGADYFASKKTTFGVVVNGYGDRGTELGDNVTLISNAGGSLDTRNTAVNNMKTVFDNIGVNLNFRQLLDTTGSEITGDVDYINYSSGNTQEMTNHFFDANGSKKKVDEMMRGYLPSNINIYSAKVDYTHPINKTSRLEAGLKSSYVETDNNALYDTLNANGWEADANRSNHFIYKENINAAYVNFNKELNKKWSIQTGLRLENTIAKGNQLTTGETFKRNYTQLFPTVYIGYNANEKNQFVLNYGRRINRPDYGSLNPFYHFLDKYTFEVGNPYLKPQFSHNVELSHSFNGFLTTTINYSRTTDIIQDVIDQIDSTNTTFIKKGNIAKRRNIGLSVSAMIPVTKWWKANIYTNVYNNSFSGLVNGVYTEVEATTFSGNISNMFTFKKGWTAEISGNYQSKALGGVLGRNPMGVVNAAVAKQVMKNKGTIRLNIRDVFFTQKFNGFAKYQNIDVTMHQYRDSRVVNLGFSYRFGKGKPVQQRKKGGAGDEQSRVGGGSN
jgi:iron complex outermembrane receptor protein